MSNFESERPYLHIVLMKFRSDVIKDDIDNIFLNLQDLLTSGVIEGLLEFSGGPYDSPEGFNKGYTHAFTMKFQNKISRDNYFPHPEHERVKEMLLAKVDDVIAFDYKL